MTYDDEFEPRELPDGIAELEAAKRTVSIKAQLTDEELVSIIQEQIPSLGFMNPLNPYGKQDASNGRWASDIATSILGALKDAGVFTPNQPTPTQDASNERAFEERIVSLASRDVGQSHPSWGLVNDYHELVRDMKARASASPAVAEGLSDSEVVDIIDNAMGRCPANDQEMVARRRIFNDLKAANAFTPQVAGDVERISDALQCAYRKAVKDPLKPHYGELGHSIALEMARDFLATLTEVPKEAISEIVSRARAMGIRLATNHGTAEDNAWQFAKAVIATLTSKGSNDGQ